MRAIKKFLQNFKPTKALYRKIASSRYKKKQAKKLEAMRMNGNKTIAAIQSILEGKCFFFFDMGTLLGIVREGHLLGHDIDIDVAVYAKDKNEIADIRKAIKDGGGVVEFSYAVEGLGPIEDSFVINGIKFDINYYTREEGKDVCYLMYRDPALKYDRDDVMSVVKLSCDPLVEIEKYDFFGTEINIPVNAERYLAQRYGDDWRIPNTKYIYWKGPSTEKTDYMGRQCTVETEI